MPNAFANVAASQTDTVLVAAVNSQVAIRVLGVMVMVDGVATKVTFNSKGTGAGTAISCDLACSANGGVALMIAPPANPEYSVNGGWFETKRGEALTVTTGTGSSTGIQLLWEPSPLTWKSP